MNSIEGERMFKQENRVPLYLQLKESLRTSITTNKLKAGDKIPTEVELSEKYNISRVTVRKAVTELVEEGYLVRKQGKGTFVQSQKIERKVVHLTSFTAACEAHGLKASSQTIKREIILPTSSDKKLLQLEEDDQLLFIQRVRYADEQPLMLENNYFSFKKYKFLLEENLEGSIYRLLQDKYQIILNNPGETSLELVRALEDEASLLDVPVGEPLFYMETVVSFDDSPVYLGKQYMVGERYKFSF
jgi:DNA-binding GntR family transcriptional regulator